MKSQCYLKFQSFNVEGLVNKIKDHDFLDSIKQNDFITLVEIWVSGKISVDIEGYYCFNKSRKKAKMAKRYSGGISVLVNKIKDHDFLDSIKKNDFITLVETWVSGKISVDIEGYYCFNKSRRKAKKAKRYSGGISVLVKKSLRKGVKLFSSKSNRLVWWKLDKHFFNLDEDIFVCSVYIPPANSKYFGQRKIDPYDELESDLIHYRKLGKIMLMGDFN